MPLTAERADQPLHVGRAKDQGGNRIKCRWAVEFGGTPELTDGDDLDGKIAKLLDRTKALTAAVAKLGKARSGTRGAEKAATELVECAAWTSGTAESIAKKRGLTEAKVVGARAGAVTGKPSVTVSAKVRGHAVNLTVDASSDAD